MLRHVKRACCGSTRGAMPLVCFQFNAPKAKKTGKKIEFVNKTPAGEKKGT